LQWY